MMKMMKIGMRLTGLNEDLHRCGEVGGDVFSFSVGR